MSFKFNFSSDTTSVKEETNSEATQNNEPVEWLKCEEVTVGSQPNSIDDDIHRANMFTCGDLEIGHVIASEALKNYNKSYDNVAMAEEQHSDLVTGKYEGGLKIWECTSDLIEYLMENVETTKWMGCEILDLGCGAGLLGIMTLLYGAEVVFQDYNKEVLDSMTIPNVLLNLDEENEEINIKKCKFYSGDWASFDEKLPKTQQFDFILTSETIYNCENYVKLTNLFSNRLKVGGTVFVAAKTYYFGVGGGTRQFESEVAKSGLQSQVVWKSSGGIQREILRLTKL